MIAQQVAAQWQQGFDLLPQVLVLDLGGYKLAIRSNSQALLDQLQKYFQHVLGSGDFDHEVTCIESPVFDAGVDFVDWKREPGKSGRKDAFYDIDDARLVLKVRTGMLFLQHEQYRVVRGPCVAYDNQVINFINAQYMNWLQQNGALICHASGLVLNQSCLGIAGFSGGGKSTLMLHLLENDQVKYLTNDRLFLKKEARQMMATGIPKLPRVNPGTIVNNPRLKPMLSLQRINELLAMPKEELWHLEEKYDVDVESVYGQRKIEPKAPIKAFLILNWSFKSDQPCTVTQVDLQERPELLQAVMKSPGPFYQFADGQFYQDEMQQDQAQYLDCFKDLHVFEATGGVDFDQAAEVCFSYLTTAAAGGSDA